VSGAGVQQAKSLAKGSLAAPQLCRLWGEGAWSLVATAGGAAAERCAW
jgi:hypothetical protein